MDECIASKDTAFHRREITLFPERWGKVVENGRNYFD